MENKGKLILIDNVSSLKPFPLIASVIDWMIFHLFLRTRERETSSRLACPDPKCSVSPYYIYTYVFIDLFITDLFTNSEVFLQPKEILFLHNPLFWAPSSVRPL